MNEIDLKTKIEGLEKAIQEHKADANRYEDQLKETQQDLKDYNKPELTGGLLDDIYEAIERGVQEFDFSDSDNYDKEFGIDYDGKVTLEQFDINNAQDLVEAIVAEVSKLFTEVEVAEDDNS